VFDGVLTELGRLGYSGELLQEAYDFNDWFVPNAPARQAAAAGFGRKPLGYDSACVAAFFSNPDPKSSLLGLRALGAPFAIEVRDDGVVPWSVGVDETTTHQSTAGRIPAGAMRRFFDAIQTKWSPDAVLRAKNIGQSVGPTEIDWVDLGLIPALENEISQKLDRLLRNALIDGQRAYKGRTGQKPESEELYRLVFRLLAGKVFHDRKLGASTKLMALRSQMKSSARFQTITGSLTIILAGVRRSLPSPSSLEQIEFSKSVRRCPCIYLRKYAC